MSARPDVVRDEAVARWCRFVRIEHNLGDLQDPGEADAVPAVDAGADAAWHAHSVADLLRDMRGGIAVLWLALREDAWPETVELDVLFASDREIAELNGRWRGKPRPTNVLSWPAADLAAGETPGERWGDLAFAYETIRREAGERGWPLKAYLTHLAVHGALHCLGYDHENDADAQEMEGIESRVLARLGLPDPYADDPA